MSSLAAAKADNFYYPTDFDPQKHGSLSKYHGQHPLRERASKLQSHGILVIRFEVPFHIWCSKCGEKIAKGERFNADKKAIGNYHSTKIWQFSMRHHCGCIITIQSDPKNAEYIVVEGARKKVEDYKAEDAGVLQLMDEEERERLRADAFYRLEAGEAGKARIKSEGERLVDLMDVADAKHADPYKVNKMLRAQLRGIKREDAALDERRQVLGLPEEVRLLPHNDDDAVTAALAFYKDDSKSRQKLSESRKAIMDQSIFSKSARQGNSAGGGGGGGMGSGASLTAAAAVAASRPGAGAPAHQQHQHSSQRHQHRQHQHHSHHHSQQQPTEPQQQQQQQQQHHEPRHSHAEDSCQDAQADDAGPQEQPHIKQHQQQGPHDSHHAAAAAAAQPRGSSGGSIVGGAALAAAAAMRKVRPLGGTSLQHASAKGHPQLGVNSGSVAKRTIKQKAELLAKRRKMPGVQLKLTKPE